MSGYTGPLAGELCDGWAWWKASFERDIYACASDTSLVWIEEDGTEHHLNGAPVAVARAMREKWCKMWGWYVIPGAGGVWVQRDEYGARDSFVTRGNISPFLPPPVRGLIVDMLGPRETHRGYHGRGAVPVFTTHEPADWGSAALRNTCRYRSVYICRLTPGAAFNRNLNPSMCGDGKWVPRSRGCSGKTSDASGWDANPVDRSWADMANRK